MVIPRTLTCLRPILQGKCIFLYCLPLHSSHLTQPLNVSFYKPLKAAWAKACTSYCTQNLGTKQWSMNFSYIFREAWISCVMLSTTVNGSVLCPFNPCSFLEKSTLLMPKSSITVMGSCCYWRCTRKDKVQKFEERLEEGYEVASDELYALWVKIKKLFLMDAPLLTVSSALVDTSPVHRVASPGEFFFWMHFRLSL